ncbi:autotransporter domain-containing protein [Thioalkalivibrio sp. ALJ24]|uniref:autotransporter family protein n=1 Tax=Thioalkalivibrio sp. ALJ24 TaxID=545276 RepID=UPI0018DCFFDC|nr:autotransporter domain-containing protein [Thioalkalivibrio sp. ALJ24]
MIASGVVWADDKTATWNGTAGDRSWFTKGNWESDSGTVTVPDSNTEAIIPGGAVEIDDEEKAEAQRLTFSGGTLEIKQESELQVDDAFVRGEELSISEGGEFRVDKQLSVRSSASMEVAGELVTRDGELRQGVNIGDMNDPGEMIITGAGNWHHKGEKRIAVGSEDSTSNVKVLDGGTLKHDSSLRVADRQTSFEGKVQVSAATLEGDAIKVGYRGPGKLSMDDEATVSHANAYAGYESDGSGTIEVKDSATWSLSENLTIGRDGGGELLVDSGGEVAVDGDLEVATDSNASGVIRIEGEDSEVDIGGSAEIGVAGDGELHVLEGATMKIESLLGLADLEEEGSSARVVVSGEDSRLETSSSANLRGQADLEILDGGKVISRTTTISNRLDTPDAARILVRGNDSELDTRATLTVGLNEGGIGKLEIRDGGYVNTTTSAATGARIGAGDSSSQGTVIVTGDNSRWRIVRDAVVGEEGQATLRIEDGGRVFDGSINGNRTLTIAQEHSSSASVVLEGNESSLDRFGGITVGKRGTGELLIGDGATVDDVGRLNVGGGRSSAIGGGQGSGMLHIDKGGKLDVDGTTSLAENDGSSGTVVVNGELRSGGGVEVGSGGVLAGDGVVQGDVSVQGTLAPGNSIGSLAVEGDGDLTLEDGSIYRVEVNDGGDEAGVNNDHVSVGGNIDIEEQASLHVTSENGTDDGSTFAPETTYTILSAEDGGVDGEFGEVTDDFAFLSTSLEYGEDAVFLTLTQVADLANVAQTPNQRAMAGTLDEQVDGEALSDITGAVVMMDEDNARAALDDLSGVDHTHTQQIGLRGAQRFRAGLTGRMPGPGGAQAPRETASLKQLAGLQLASAGQPRGLLDEAADVSRGWWVNAEGGRGDIDDTTNASGADYRFSGLTIGFDAPVSEELHLGAAMGYTRNRGDTAGGDIDVDSIHFAAYGGWQRDALYARGSVGMAYHSTDTERFVDTVGRTAEADYSARGVGMRAEGGYTFEIGDTARLTPFGGLDYEYLRRSGFSESGAGAANLDVNRESEYSLRSQAGVRFDQAFETTGGWVAPYAEASWVHEHGDRSSAMDTAFAADSSSRFTIDGPRLSRDRVRVAAGLDARLNEDSFLNVGYQGEIASSDDLHAIGLTFRRNW